MERPTKLSQGIVGWLWCQWCGEKFKVVKGYPEDRIRWRDGDYCVPCYKQGVECGIFPPLGD